MKIIFRYISVIVLAGAVFVSAACSDDDFEEIKMVRPDASAVAAQLVDKNATEETRALYYNLKYYSQKYLMFGHQSDNAEGYDGNQPWQDLCESGRNAGRSDVLEVTGSYPAVFGFDFLFLTNFMENTGWAAQVRKALLINAIDAYNRGGVLTFSWHCINPIGKKDFYWEKDPTPAVAQVVVPGTEANISFNSQLDLIAEFASKLIGADGKKIPVIFRPWHENDGAWFWWGNSHCTSEEFVALYRYTVDYLRGKGVNNFLYAYSPGTFKTNGPEGEDAYHLRCYPGDDYVDMVGIDNYSEVCAPYFTTFGREVRFLSEFAKKHDKLAAITETGCANVECKDWFSEKLYRAAMMEKLSSERNICYALVWGNSKEGYWTPYKGHTAEQDFIKFRHMSDVWFLSDLPDMYKIN